MNIKIKRFNSEQEINEIVDYDIKHNKTVLESLIEVKVKYDESLAFRCGCRTGVCGSCSVRVNGVEKLACKSKLNENDLIEPIKNTKVIKDLIVDLEHESKLLKSSNSFLNKLEETNITKEDEKLIDTQSNCILCQSCFSSCPIYEVNDKFLGPYALTRVLRYVDDKKESNKLQTLEKVQDNGVWDCTLCGNCTIVCPQFIDPKTDIMNLRMKSVQNGFEDRSMQYMTGAGFDGGFNTGFDPTGGFNPNGF